MVDQLQEHGESRARWERATPSISWIEDRPNASATPTLRSPFLEPLAGDWQLRWPRSLSPAGVAWAGFNASLRVDGVEVLGAGTRQRPTTAAIVLTRQALTLTTAQGRAIAPATPRLTPLEDAALSFTARWPLETIGAVQYIQEFDGRHWQDAELHVFGRGRTAASTNVLHVRGADYVGDAPNPHPQSLPLDGLAGALVSTIANATQRAEPWSTPPAPEAKQRAAGVRSWNAQFPGGPPLEHLGATARGRGGWGDDLIDAALDVFS